MDHFWHFNGLFSTQNINITHFSVIFKHRDTVLLGDFEIMFALVFFFRDVVLGESEEENSRAK